MSKSDEELARRLLTEALGVTFSPGKLDLGGWGESDLHADPAPLRKLIVEVEHGQKHPTTNIAKIWPWLEAQPDVRVLFVHAFITPNAIPGNRQRVAAWIGEQLEHELQGRLLYRRLVIDNEKITEGIGALTRAFHDWLDRR